MNRTFSCNLHTDPKQCIRQNSLCLISLNNFMAQFDFSTLFSVITVFFVTCFFFYSSVSLKLLPEIIYVLKFRAKKLKNSLFLDVNFTQYFLC